MVAAKAVSLRNDGICSESKSSSFFYYAIKKHENKKIFSSSIGDGKQLRSYTYVSDIVDGIMNSVNGKGDGEIYNISGGSVCSILELAEIVLDVTESDLEIEFAPQSEYRWSDEWVKIPLGLTAKDENGNWYDERNYVADNTKALNGFGYDPKIELKDGIKKMWDWMNK